MLRSLFAASALIVLFAASGALAQEGTLTTFCAPTDNLDATIRCDFDPSAPGPPADTSLVRGSVSADGSRIAFVETRDGERVFVVSDLDGSDETVEGDATGVSSLAIAPDGTRLAYMLQSGGSVTLSVFDTETDVVTTVTSLAASFGQIEWFPDGQRLLYQEATMGDVRAVDADGSSPSVVLFPNPVNSGLAFDVSPDGSQVVVLQRFASDGINRISTIPASGGTPTDVYQETDVLGSQLRSIEWSPDGDFFAVYRSQFLFDTGERRYSAEIIPASGGTPTVLYATLPSAPDAFNVSGLIEWFTSRGLVVTETGDAPDADLGDDRCDADPNLSGDQCTLRAAIQEANARDGADTITFDLGGSGPFLIAPGSPLPTLTEAVEIDGATQPGTAEVPLVRLHGAAAGGDAVGLRIEADDVTIRGLMVTGFGSHGIEVASGADGVLEGLIVGSDAAGADGLGNGGDGIHVSGGTGLRIGADEETAARSAINLNVASLGNLLNGLYARDEDNAALIRQRRAGVSGLAEARAINLNVSGLLAGLVNTPSGPVARPNGENGVCLLGARGATLKNLTVSDAVRNALEITASQDVTVLGGRFGMRRPFLTAAADIGAVGESMIRVAQSINVALGSDDAEDEPVQGGGADEWFIDVEASEQVDVRNALGGIVEGIAEVAPAIREALRNAAGGLRIADSPNVTVGMEGLATVFANNGGDTSQPQAGLFATGALTDGLRAINLHLGTTADGLTGLGNAGSGAEIADGVRNLLLGGDTDAEQIVSGGNGGYGFLFRDLDASAGQRRPDGRAINVGIGLGLLSGLIEDASGQTLPVPNALSGFCLLRVQNAALEQLSAGANGLHGIEILESENVEVPSARIGSLFGRLLDAVDDVAAPDGDGVFLSNSTGVSLGGLRDGAAALADAFLVHGVGGRGLMASGLTESSVSGLGIGVAPEGSAVFEGLTAILGPGAEGGMFEDVEDVRIDSVAVLGAGRAGSGGGLLFNVGRLIQITNSSFGEIGADGLPARTSAGAAIVATAIDSLSVATSQLSGHLEGLVAELSSTQLDGNTFEQQGFGASLGRAIRQSGGSLEGTRNSFFDTVGPALRVEGLGEALLRLNNFFGNDVGVEVDDPGATFRPGGAHVQAPENWWGDASGPGGAGPGSGDAVSEGVDFSNWLTAPLGVLVAPEAYVVESGVTTPVTFAVRFASPLVGQDVLDVTVTDERGWLTSASAFTVPVGTSGYAMRTVGALIGGSAASAVTIRAVSQADGALAGEATVVLMSPGTALPLASGIPAGTTTLPVDGTDGYVVGGTVIVNPGGASEERGVISGFGSILLEAPTRFAHRAGEVVIPANALAVAGEDAPETAVPTDLSVSAHPNPARAAATVAVALPTAGEARVEVYDALGRRVAVLHDGPMAAGTHALTLRADGWAPGVYVVRAETADGSAVRRLTVVR